MDFLKELETLNFTTDSRQRFSSKALNTPKYLEEAINFLSTSKLERSERILAALEFASRENSFILYSYSEQLIQLAESYSGNSGKRALSKIFLNYIQNPNFKVTPKQKEKIITISFLWLISNEKVAVKAFSMQTLHSLSEEYQWIRDDLKAILIKDYNLQSTGYKACSRKILKKLE